MAAEAKIAECVPNFSTGQDEDTVAALAACAGALPGVMLADWSSDVDHGRSVFTLLGEPEALARGVFRLCALAVERIDLGRHAGVHPRMGAADVVPFVPLRNMGMEECAALARQVGKRLGEELCLPVLLYEYAASAPHRANLADVRRGGFEGLAEKLITPAWRPDYGPATPHPTAGAAAVGARWPLIAFNVELDTGNVEIARAIAKKIRAAGGGLPAVKAIGLLLESSGRAQVSMNLVDYRQTGLAEVVEAVRQAAQAFGVGIAHTELIGAAPARALVEAAAQCLHIQGFDWRRQVLESPLDGLLDTGRK